MTGIAEMFAEYEEAERDWFQLAFAFERETEKRTDRQREYSARHRMRRCDDERKLNREYMRSYMRSYDKTRRASDPAYLEMRRRVGREANRRYYAKKRAERLAARMGA